MRRFRDTEWAAKALEITNGRGVDNVVEFRGPDTLGQSIRACGIGGHIALIDVLTGLQEAEKSRRGLA